MSAPPTELPTWATSGSAQITHPSTGLQNAGYTPNTAAGAGVMNWFKNLTYQWLNFLKQDHVGQTQIETNALFNTSQVTVFGGTTPVFAVAARDTGSGNPRIVAVGLTGSIATSDDFGATWTARTSGVLGQLEDVKWIPSVSLFIAVGALGVILTSPDGTTWTSRTSGVTDTLFRIATDGTRVMIGGGNGVVLRSTNGTSWTLGDGTNISNISVLSILPVGGAWVLCGGGGLVTRDTCVARSVDNGAGWTTIPISFLDANDRVLDLTLQNGVVHGLVVNNSTGAKKVIQAPNLSIGSLTPIFDSSKTVPLSALDTASDYYMSSGSGVASNSIVLMADKPRKMGAVFHDWRADWFQMFMLGFGSIGRFQELELGGVRMWVGLGVNGTPDDRGKLTISRPFTFNV